MHRGPARHLPRGQDTVEGLDVGMSCASKQKQTRAQAQHSMENRRLKMYVDSRRRRPRRDDHDGEDGADEDNDEAGDEDDAHDEHADEATMGTGMTVTICPGALFC